MQALSQAMILQQQQQKKNNKNERDKINVTTINLAVYFT